MKIREVSRKYGISMDNLRYYEKMELIGTPQREGKQRVYDDNIGKELDFIMSARNAGVPIDLLKKFMIANRDENVDLPEKKELLKEEIEYIKANMAKEQLFINKINSQIEKYDKVLEERARKEQERIEREKTREYKLEQERLAKEKAKEEKRIAKEKAKEEARLAKEEAKRQAKLERLKAKKAKKLAQLKEKGIDPDEEDDDE